MNTIVAFQGERGAYSDEAITKLATQREWPGTLRRVPCWGFEDVLNAIANGKAQYGMIPVENSSIGAINDSLEALGRNDSAKIVDEVLIPIRHCLLAVPGARIETLTTVHSHPAALDQCKIFLANHSHIKARVSYDTAGAAREVAARGSPYEAAIASRAAAERYKLEVLIHDIQDDPNNWTRFAVVTRTGAH